VRGDGADADELGAMIERVQRIRDRSCEPKNNGNPRYHALSLVVTNLRKAADDIRVRD
jgi:hypothetical protein